MTEWGMGVAAIVLVGGQLPATPALTKPGKVAATAPEFSLEMPEKCRNLGYGAKGKRVVGKVLNKVAGEKATRLGMKVFNPLLEVGSVLTNAIACRLDPAEQKQAAEASDKAVASGKVNTMVAWRSATREGVSGSSTVTAAVAGGGGAKCLMVADFIIVDGEETRVEKRMCRAPGQARYVLSA